jgi:hypothetical protein
LAWFAKENRRAAPRHGYDGNNTWIRLEGSLTRPCQVLDLSRTGVRLRVTNAHSLPNTFTLMLSKNGGGCRPARVKWRRGNEVGAEFFRADPTSVSQSTAHTPRANSSPASRSTAHTPRANSLPASGSTADAPRANSSSSSLLAAEAPRAVKPRAAESQKSEDSQMSNLGEQLDRADQEKNGKKRVDLSWLQKKLGPDHIALIELLEDVDPESPHGQELASIIKNLNQTCK